MSKRLGHSLWQAAKQKKHSQNLLSIPESGGKISNRLGHSFKRQNKKQLQKEKIPWPKKTWSEIIGDPFDYGMEKTKTKNSGEYTGSAPAFCATHHAALIRYKERCEYVCSSHTARVRINRVRLPILLVVN